VSLRADFVVPSVARHEAYRPLKRLFDVAVCLAIMPLVAPVLLVCAIAVRLDSPGPMLFTQQRTGQHGVRFGMLKFRTMVRDAEALKASLMHLNILPPPDFKIIDDPRITRVGRFLRKTSLDELPQLWSVLRGDMSLVGPRPLRQFEVAALSGWQRQRQAVRPGVTGLWQVLGRSEVGWEERMGLDCSYALHWSVRCDLDILARTVPALLKRTGAR
jgi:lipopolysaccharide/colanic/teichoic acid biosynthesis glycosyltransferase